MPIVERLFRKPGIEFDQNPSCAPAVAAAFTREILDQGNSGVKVLSLNSALNSQAVAHNIALNLNSRITRSGADSLPEMLRGNQRYHVFSGNELLHGDIETDPGRHYTRFRLVGSGREYSKNDQLVVNTSDLDQHEFWQLVRQFSGRGGYNNTIFVSYDVSPAEDSISDPQALLSKIDFYRAHTFPDKSLAVIRLDHSNDIALTGITETEANVRLDTDVSEVAGFLEYKKKLLEDMWLNLQARVDYLAKREGAEDPKTIERAKNQLIQVEREITIVYQRLGDVVHAVLDPDERISIIAGRPAPNSSIATEGTGVLPQRIRHKPEGRKGRRNRSKAGGFRYPTGGERLGPGARFARGMRVEEATEAFED